MSYETCPLSGGKITACPFCGASRGPLVADSSVVTRRMSRAAIGIGAAGTAVALMMTNCSAQASYGMADSGVYAFDTGTKDAPNQASPDATADASNDAETDASGD